MDVEGFVCAFSVDQALCQGGPMWMIRCSDEWTDRKPGSRTQFGFNKLRK